MCRIWKKGNNKVVTQTPYNEEFVEFARNKKAKWNNSEKLWTFTDIDFEIIKSEMEKYYSEIKIGKVQIDDPFNFDLLREEPHEWQQLSKELQDYFLDRIERIEKKGEELVIHFHFAIALKINAVKTKEGFTIENTAIMQDATK